MGRIVILQKMNDRWHVERVKSGVGRNWPPHLTNRTTQYKCPFCQAQVYEIFGDYQGFPFTLRGRGWMKDSIAVITYHGRFRNSYLAPLVVESLTVFIGYCERDSLL